MIIIKDGSHAKRIIKLLLCTGEFPYQSLGILGEIHSVKRAVKRMSEVHEVKTDSEKIEFFGKIVNISGKGQLKTIRLNAYAFGLVKSLFPEMMEHYQYHTRNHRFRGDSLSVERNHRVAEAIAMFLMAGVDLFSDRVPALETVSTNRKEYMDPVFYHCRQLKSIVVDELKKNQYTRIVGSIFYESGCYSIYNARDSVMMLSGEGESKTKRHLESIAKKNTFCDSVGNALLFGKSYDVAERTLLAVDSNPRESEVFGNIYKAYHFIPMDAFGVKLIQLFTTPYWREELIDQLYESHEVRKEVGNFQYDAKSGDMHYFSFLDSDLVKLRSVRNHILKEKEDLTVLCFKEQEAFLRSYMGPSVEIKLYDIEEIMDTLECVRRDPL